MGRREAFSGSLRPLQSPHLRRRISALCVYALWVLLARLAL
ncbi:hypothetical protein HMPREF9371_0492 [Neisseria shayeganii 871]|uniref:Uncharacterized protein n=1 Tax=Neisseria shayeganii 871 TaxID=1032488 RepID=G4CFV3_9NEIS|nr:hypothetical protein HMPREF9371_0492 [Neisseria shayeganii 871]